MAAKPEWVEQSPEEIEELIVKLHKEGQSTSQIGITLRDQHGIPNTKAVLGEKITDILKRNPKVYVSCVGDVTPATDRFTTEFESAAFSGTACEVTDIQEKIKALRLICEKYTPDNMENFEDAITKSLDRTAVWKIRIENLTGKRKKYDKSGEEMKFGRME